MAEDKPNGWNEWSKFVLRELERLNDAYEGMVGEVNKVRIDLNSELNKVRVDIATLKVKSGIWGAIGGLIPVGILIAYLLVKIK